MKKGIAILCFVLALVLSGCQTRFQPRAGSALRALTIAEAQFERKYPGRITDFDISISDHPEDDEWSIWFNQKNNGDPGGDTLITVNKKTGQPVIEPSF